MTYYQFVRRFCKNGGDPDRDFAVAMLVLLLISLASYMFG